ncbi:hypothetical protein TKK_0000379 [Trichogramma kaykai]
MPRQYESLVVLVLALIVHAIPATAETTIPQRQDCRSNPCMYGICVDDPNSSYRCYCIDGYTGIDCDINWDDCWSSPCLNGGTCSDAIASYNCSCPEGYVGLSCEQRYSECMNQPCLNNGTCLDREGGLSCICLEGFSGEYCEIDASVCNQTVCRNGGECQEGPGLSFVCRCPDGWQGPLCDQDVDECSSSTPCQNSGLCINLPGSYACACLFGYTGKDCDKRVVPCERNPCANNAVCLSEDSQPVCYCVPDYHGQFCEQRYDDCASKNARCANGGTCIDGVNDYTCSCPPPYTGPNCNHVLRLPPSSWSTVHEIATAATAASTGSAAETLAPVTFGYATTDGDEPTVTRLTDLLPTTTASSSVASVSEATARHEDGNATAREPSTVSPGVRFDPQDPLKKTTMADLPSEHPTTEYTTLPLESRSEGDEEAAVPPPTTTILPADLRPDFHELPTTMKSIEDGAAFTLFTTEFVETVYPALMHTTDARADKSIGDNATTIKTLITLSDEITTTTTTTTPKTYAFTDSSKTTITTSDRDDWRTIAPVSTTANDPSISKGVASVESPGQEEETTSGSSGGDSTVRPTPTSSDTSESVLSGSTRMTARPIMTARPTSQTIEVLETASTIDGSTDEDFTSVTEFHKVTFGVDMNVPTMSTTTTTTTATDEQPTIGERPPVASVHACNKDQCANVSLCVDNGTRCDCSHRGNCRLDGSVVTSPAGGVSSVEHAAFNGKSYIRQKFAIDSGELDIFIGLRTKAKSGIIVHALFDDERYVLLYIESGQLKFQFSCGLQTMMFGELDAPVNNGHGVDVQMSFSYIVEAASDKCSARLLVNGSLAMSGEQLLHGHEAVPQYARLHLGGIPVAFSHQFPQIVMGFVGCMSSLRVNGLQRDFIRDAVEAVHIEECNSFLCLSSPCKNYGACEEADGKIICRCVSGYTGEFCEKSACDNNPCHLGATCLASPGVNFICVCPLGTHGQFCDKDTTIAQPSFTIFSPGVSSYMAYGVSSSLKDSMELRLRIIPQALDQISLIAYLGQSSGTRRDSSDHFSVTYVRGYLMLTWDLGSGVRRIFTSSPLSLRPSKAHYLQIGRRGRESWLYVDGIGNVTGRAAGANTRLDVSPILYIGGHKSRYFEALPHDLPLHTGFSGCIYDVELRTDDTVFPVVTMSSPATGRGVGECHRNECLRHSCKNGAVCLNYGPTYSCICMKGWEGSDCSSPINCTSSNSLCHANSK